MLLALGGMARATTVIPPDLPTLVRETDYVVRARVRAVESAWRTDGGVRRIVSRVTLDVVEAVAGQPPETVVLEVLGGRVGDEEMMLEGVPWFAPGDDAIYFVQGNGRQIYPLTRMMHGVYPVMREAATGREYVARSNRVPLEAVAEISQPIAAASVAGLQRRLKGTATALTPGEFVRQIRAVREAGEIDARQH